MVSQLLQHRLAIDVPFHGVVQHMERNQSGEKEVASHNRNSISKNDYESLPRGRKARLLTAPVIQDIKPGFGHVAGGALRHHDLLGHQPHSKPLGEWFLTRWDRAGSKGWPFSFTTASPFGPLMPR